MIRRAQMPRKRVATMTKTRRVIRKSKRQRRPSLGSRKNETPKMDMFIISI
jgi:hypothetical protein